MGTLDITFIEERNHLQEQLIMYQTNCKRIAEERDEVLRRFAEERDATKYIHVQHDEDKKLLLASFIEEKNKV